MPIERKIQRILVKAVDMVIDDDENEYDSVMLRRADAEVVRVLKTPLTTKEKLELQAQILIKLRKNQPLSFE